VVAGKALLHELQTLFHPPPSSSHRITITYFNFVLFLSPRPSKWPFSKTLSCTTEQSPSRETNRFSARQEILGILWDQKFNYHNYKCHLPVPVLRFRRYFPTKITYVNKFYCHQIAKEIFLIRYYNMLRYLL
jgi:hypothetical protein